MLSPRRTAALLWLFLALSGCKSKSDVPFKVSAAPDVATPRPAAKSDVSEPSDTTTPRPTAKSDASAPSDATTIKAIPTAEISAHVERMHGKDEYPCTGHPICQQPSPPDGTLVTSASSFEHLDPTQITETEGLMIADNLFEGLIVTGVDKLYTPGVATRWELSEDGLVWTFYLRRNARWSNGRTVNAHDFVYSLLRKMSPELGSKSAEQVYLYVKNGKPYNEGKLKDTSKVGLRAVDDFTFEVTLDNPTPFFLEYVRTPHYFPVPKEVVEAHGDKWIQPANIVTNGPYILAEHRPQDRVVLAKSETYWQKDSVRIPRVVIHQLNKETEDWIRYESGQQHWVRSFVPTSKMTALMREKRPDFLIDPYLCYYYYDFRTDKPPFDDVRMRRAINMAIDKERLVRHVTRGMQRPADGPVPGIFRKTMGYPKPRGDRFDPAQARALLSEAGYPKGVGLPKITLIYNTLDAHRDIAVFVQSSVKEHLGIELEIENLEWKTLLHRRREHEFQMSRTGWCAHQEPYTFMTPFMTDSANNASGYKNPAFDEKMEASMRERDHAKRMQLLADAEAMIQRDMPIAPLYYYTKAYLKVPVLRGFVPELSNNHRFQYMYWGDKEVRE